MQESARKMPFRHACTKTIRTARAQPLEAKTGNWKARVKQSVETKLYAMWHNVAASYPCEPHAQLIGTNGVKDGAEIRPGALQTMWYRLFVWERSG